VSSYVDEGFLVLAAEILRHIENEDLSFHKKELINIGKKRSIGANSTLRWNFSFGEEILKMPKRH
jgi:hypothetical protein